MSRSNDGRGGCLAQLLGMGLLLIISFFVDLYNGSQYGMMRDARDHDSCDRYLDYLDKYPSGKYAIEAKDSIVTIFSRHKEVSWLYRNIDKLSENLVCEK